MLGSKSFNIEKVGHGLKPTYQVVWKGKSNQQDQVWTMFFIQTPTCEEHEVFDVVDVGKVKPDQLLELCFCRRKVLKKKQFKNNHVDKAGGSKK